MRNHVIDKKHFIQVDLSNLPRVLFKIGGVQSGEDFEIYCSSTQNALETSIFTIASNAGCEKTALVTNICPYLSDRATTENIVINAITLDCSVANAISAFTPTYAQNAEPSNAPWLSSHQFHRLVPL